MQYARPPDFGLIVSIDDHPNMWKLTITQSSVFQHEPSCPPATSIIDPFAKEAFHVRRFAITFCLDYVILVLDYYQHAVQRRSLLDLPHDLATSRIVTRVTNGTYQDLSLVANSHCLRNILILSSAPLSPSSTRFPLLSRTNASAPFFIANSTRRRSRRLSSAPQ
jgi:hypothetical protein